MAINADAECRRQLAHWEAVYRTSLVGLKIATGVIPVYRAALGLDPGADLAREAAAMLRGAVASTCSAPGCRAPVWQKDSVSELCYGHHPASRGNPTAFAAWAARHASDAPEFASESTQGVAEHEVAP